jgi:hypothetical protein
VIRKYRGTKFEIEIKIKIAGRENCKNVLPWNGPTPKYLSGVGCLMYSTSYTATQQTSDQKKHVILLL